VYPRLEIIIMKEAPAPTPRFDPVSENPLRDGFVPSDLAPKPNEPENGVDEKSEDQLKKFEREIWDMAGVVKESRLLEGRLLALVHISKEYKRFASDSEKGDVCAKQSIEGPKKDGLYLVLKTSGGLSFFGGHHADRMDAYTLNIAFQNFGKILEFAMFSMEIEENEDERDRYKEELRKKIMSNKGPSA
jgi:hypothetical protein